MKTMHAPVVPFLLGAVLAATSGSVAALDPPGPEQTVIATAAGTLAPANAVALSAATSEPVLFGGQAAITGRVIYDTVFGAPPVLEIRIDFSGVTAKGARTGKAYVVSSQAIMHRPLLALDTVEVAFSFAADGNPLLARAALASFNISYSAATGIAATPLRIAALPSA